MPKTTAQTHTPGPWRVVGAKEEPHGPRYYRIESSLIRADAQNLVADVNIYNYGTEGIANARLIAAAPDLLEALRLLLDACARGPFGKQDWVDYESDPERRWGYFTNQARAAIAKAEGRE